MKLILKKDNNAEVEITEIQSINKECKQVIFFIDGKLREEDLERLQNVLSEKLKKDVIILGPGFSNKIYAVV